MMCSEKKAQEKVSSYSPSWLSQFLWCGFHNTPAVLAVAVLGALIFLVPNIGGGFRPKVGNVGEVGDVGDGGDTSKTDSTGKADSASETDNASEVRDTIDPPPKGLQQDGSGQDGVDAPKKQLTDAQAAIKNLKGSIARLEDAVWGHNTTPSTPEDPPIVERLAVLDYRINLASHRIGTPPPEQDSTKGMLVRLTNLETRVQKMEEGLPSADLAATLSRKLLDTELTIPHSSKPNAPKTVTLETLLTSSSSRLASIETRLPVPDSNLSQILVDVFKQPVDNTEGPQPSAQGRQPKTEWVNIRTIIENVVSEKLLTPLEVSLTRDQIEAVTSNVAKAMEGVVKLHNPPPLVDETTLPHVLFSNCGRNDRSAEELLGAFAPSQPVLISVVRGNPEKTARPGGLTNVYYSPGGENPVGSLRTDPLSFQPSHLTPENFGLEKKHKGRVFLLLPADEDFPLNDTKLIETLGTAWKSWPPVVILVHADGETSEQVKKSTAYLFWRKVLEASGKGADLVVTRTQSQALDAVNKTIESRERPSPVESHEQSSP